MKPVCLSKGDLGVRGPQPDPICLRVNHQHLKVLLRLLQPWQRPPSTTKQPPGLLRGKKNNHISPQKCMHGRVNQRQMRMMLICLLLTHSKEEEEEMEEVENKDGDTRENYLNCTEGELWGCVCEEDLITYIAHYCRKLIWLLSIIQPVNDQHVWFKNLRLQSSKFESAEHRL